MFLSTKTFFSISQTVGPITVLQYSKKRTVFLKNFAFDIFGNREALAVPILFVDSWLLNRNKHEEEGRKGSKQKENRGKAGRREGKESEDKAIKQEAKRRHVVGIP